MVGHIPSQAPINNHCVQWKQLGSHRRWERAMYDHERS